LPAGEEVEMKDEDHLDAARSTEKLEEGHHDAPGTFVLTLILLLSFAVYYFANWKALADVWHVR